MSLTAVGVLDVEHPQRIRVQPPQSRDWIEVPGEFAWVSETKKQAGIRFHELTPAADSRIKNWIASEASPSEAHRERRPHAKREIPLPVYPNERVPAPSILAPEIFQAAAPEEPRAPSSPATVTAPEFATMEDLPQVSPQARGATSEAAGETEKSSRAVERRTHARCRVKSLVYVEMGKSNCGVVVNLSEDGLQLEAASALIGDRVPPMRFQLPHSRKWIESSGKLIWTSESRLKAGIQFVDLPTDERAEILQWASVEASPVQFPPPSEPVHQNSGRIGRWSISDSPRSKTVRSGASDNASRTLSTPLPSPSPTSSPVIGKLPAAVSVPSIRFPNPLDEARQHPRAKGMTSWMKSRLPAQIWRTLAAPIALVVLLSFFLGWYAARQRAEDKANQIAGVTAEATSGSTNSYKAPPTSTNARPPSEGVPQQGHQPATPANRNASVPVIATGTAGLAGRGAQHSPENSVSNASRRATGNFSATSRPLEPPVTRPVANVSAPSEKETSPRAPGALTTPAIPDRPAVIPTTEKEGATPSPKPPEVPAIPAGSVSVSFPAFPSIRVPPELKSQTSRLGTSLQIGQLISRVEPVYPDELRRQGIEGTVKLHATVGRDGAVQSVGLLSGPPSLSALAIDAIRRWQFKQTLLGGQPIETEEDITVVFRLANPVIRSQ